MVPFALDSPDPEPLQFINELHRHGATMNDFQVALTRLRATNHEAYLALVDALRTAR